jgi:hypothetical protein
MKWVIFNIKDNFTVWSPELNAERCRAVPNFLSVFRDLRKHYRDLYVPALPF